VGGGSAAREGETGMKRDRQGDGKVAIWIDRPQGGRSHWRSHRRDGAQLLRAFSLKIL